MNLKARITTAGLAFVLASSVLTGSAAAQSKALALTWNGSADTDVNFSEFFNSDFTIALRFMQQFPNSYEGPMVAENGSGVFMIGQGDYAGGTVGTKLMVAIGSASQLYNVNDTSHSFPLPTGLKPAQWHHLALVATSTYSVACYGTPAGVRRIFTVYLDGNAIGSPVSVCASDPSLPQGTLRFGKRTTGQTVNGRNAQFYGLLDDVAVFTRALTSSDISSLSSPALQLTGSENGLLAGFTFNGESLPARLSRTVKLSSPARLAAVSTGRNSSADALALPVPSQVTEMTLPFPPGEAWQVIQGNDDATGSHNGYASFCWDFIVADAPQNGVYPKGSDGAPFYAAAPGPVNRVIQSHVNGDADPNLVEILQAPSEYAAYLHLRMSSATVTAGTSVTRGQQLALTGNTGPIPAGAYHLHFAASDKQDQAAGFVTFPIAFSNYEVRDASGNWTRVTRGVPVNGQVVRRAVDHVNGKSTVTQVDNMGNYVIHSFAQGSNGHLMDNHWDGSTWQWSDQKLPAGLSSIYNPNAIIYRGGAIAQIYCFATANNGHLVVNYWDGSAWKWADQGLPPGATAVYNPSTTTFGPSGTQIFVFATANNGHLVVNYWDGSVWKWADQGLPSGATNVNNPSAVTPDGVQLYAFGTTDSGRLVVNHWNGGSWAWEDRGLAPHISGSGGVMSPNAVVYHGSGGAQVYVFCTGNDGQLVANYGAGSSWQWAAQGRPAGVSTVYLPNAVTFGVAGLYVFSTANNGHLVVNYWDGSVWRWADQGVPPGGTAMSSPNSIAFGSSGLYVFGTNNGHLFLNYTNGSGWSWADQGLL